MSYRNTFTFADIPVEVNYQSSYLTTLCKDYLTELAPRYTVTVTEEDVRKEGTHFDSPFGYGYLESLAVYRKVCEALISESILLFHCSAIMVEGKAYLFTAPSGTGKSTHARLWRNMLGEKAVMINDDKPLIRIENGTAVVYGTPYDGKERLSTKTSAPIAGICILSQAKENRICPVSARDALPTLLSQTYRSPLHMAQTLPLVVALSHAAPIFRLACNISEEAAALSYQTMKGIVL